MLLSLAVLAQLTVPGAARPTAPATTRPSVVAPAATPASVGTAGAAGTGLPVPPVQPPASARPVAMVDAQVVVDAPLRAAYASRLGVADSSVVWRWARDGMLPVPEGATAKILTIGRDGQATVQLSMGGASLGLAMAVVGQRATVAIAARPIRSGTVLDSADRVFRVDTLWGDPRSAPVLDVIGWEARAPLAEGTVLAPPRVRPKAAVIGGRSVLVVWRTDGIDVRREGTALTNAILGEKVRVRLGDARGPSQVIEARVIGTALVEAP